MAGLRAGVFSNWDDIEQCIAIKTVIQPNMENHRIYEQMFSVYTELYEVNKALFHKVNG